LGFLLSFTTRKLVSPLTFLSPIPANKNPVTVSCSTATQAKEVRNEGGSYFVSDDCDEG
jgi:hypothetical protein